jgi:hypothetical protein
VSDSGAPTKEQTTKLGAFYSEDPRLRPVAPGWRRKNHDKDHLYTLFVNKETGEDSEEAEDLRLTPDSIRARGVKVETIELV